MSMLSRQWLAVRHLGLFRWGAEVSESNGDVIELYPAAYELV